MDKFERKYLERLSEIYPTIAKASTEIINLSATLSLPKGTEHFITDIHGEYEAFSHVLKNGSGAVRKKVTEVFGRTLSQSDIRELSTLIYYPQEKIELVRRTRTEAEMKDWYKVMLYRLIAVCKYTASKYTREKVRNELPDDFAFVIEELITEKDDIEDKEAYYEEIINTIIRIERADVFIIALAELIPKLTVDHLHILGDIYDRGSGADDIMDKLMEYHSLDIQWGNHDLVWMGAAAGQLCCIANVVRVCARYGNLDTLEDGYGINLLPLAAFALKTYKDDPCSCFKIKNTGGSVRAEDEAEDTSLNMKIHKAISIIQFKLQGQIAKKRPEFHMEDRAVMEFIDYEKGTVTFPENPYAPDDPCAGKTYRLLDTNFPTVDPSDPDRLSQEEELVMERLQSAFLGCHRLQAHIQFLLHNGSLYKVHNGNLLYHGCMPLDESGHFKDVQILTGSTPIFAVHFSRQIRGTARRDAIFSGGSGATETRRSSERTRWRPSSAICWRSRRRTRSTRMRTMIFWTTRRSSTRSSRSSASRAVTATSSTGMCRSGRASRRSTAEASCWLSTAASRRHIRARQASPGIPSFSIHGA